jgi:hypothetical protein
MVSTECGIGSHRVPSTLSLPRFVLVQCALRYDALDIPSRQAIWQGMLQHSPAAVASDIDVAALATHPLNGRQIKNSLQLAFALCQHEGVPLQQRHLTETLRLTAAFAADASEQPESCA